MDRQTLYSLIDELPPEDLELLYSHIKERREVLSLHHATETFQADTDEAHHAPAETIREEVNAIIDDAITSVRRKRETQELIKPKL